MKVVITDINTLTFDDKFEFIAKELSNLSWDAITTFLSDDDENINILARGIIDQSLWENDKSIKEEIIDEFYKNIKIDRISNIEFKK